MPALKRNVGVFGAASMGIANIIGAGIFVLSGVAAGIAGPSVILSFLAAGGVALLTALSAAELSSFITETGASYAFTKRAFGRFWSFLVGWFKYFDYIVGAATVSVGFAAYFTELFGLQGTTAPLCAAVDLDRAHGPEHIIGVRGDRQCHHRMASIKVFAIVLVRWPAAINSPSRHFDLAHFTPFFPTGINGTLHGAAIIFFAFLGFNTVSMMSEETRDPAHTIPRALILAFIVSFVLYMCIAAVEIGVLDWRMLAGTASPLDMLARNVSHFRPFIDLIAFSALVATGSVVLSSIVGGTRASYAMGRDRLLPHPFDRVSKRFGTPYISILFSGGVIIVLAAVFYDDIGTIASVVNFGSLFTYLFVHLSLIKLRQAEPDVPRPFRAPLYPVVPVLGVSTIVGLMVYLTTTAQIAAVIWMAVGIGVYYLMSRVIYRDAHQSTVGRHESHLFRRRR
ncbi:MAG: amino acid permease [Flavobacteriales bacterium]|nr:amino acid permease [Flavobacteriales bacterium]